MYERIVNVSAYLNPPDVCGRKVVDQGGKLGARDWAPALAGLDLGSPLDQGAMRVATIVRMVGTEPNNLNLDLVPIVYCGLPHQRVPTPEVGAMVPADEQMRTGWYQVRTFSKEAIKCGRMEPRVATGGGKIVNLELLISSLNGTRVSRLMFLHC